MVAYCTSVILVALGTGLAASVLGGIIPTPLALAAFLIAASGHLLAILSSTRQLRIMMKRNDRGRAVGGSTSSSEVGGQVSDMALIEGEDFGIRIRREHERVSFDIKHLWCDAFSLPVFALGASPIVLVLYLPGVVSAVRDNLVWEYLAGAAVLSGSLGLLIAFLVSLFMIPAGLRRTQIVLDATGVSIPSGRVLSGRARVMPAEALAGVEWPGDLCVVISGRGCEPLIVELPTVGAAGVLFWLLRQGLAVSFPEL